MSHFYALMLTPLSHWGILLVGTAVFFILGWLWYSPITPIGKKWATYFPPPSPADMPSASGFAVMMGIQLLMSVSYAWITILLWMIAHQYGLSPLFATAFVLKVYGGFVFIKDLGHWYFEKKPMTLTLIGLGYYLVGILLVSTVCTYGI